ncbi:uncharacterized protein LOC119356961 isoform X2 [Triticum dicoccoides]|uniref:uncharacterized protein LOC119356961 isoform X2 n=1 Tax=Triticum dicoccoides TaxID=85692 RepID=UPI000E7C999F|nr:uncharacterized protein LOC119356961 isoform X2 [Triticum dicoccoides]
MCRPSPNEHDLASWTNWIKGPSTIHFLELSHVLVKMTLKNYFRGQNDLYLLQIDTAKIADGLIYEAADGCNYFPHFYGPDRSFAPLQLSAVVKADKIELANNDFTCSLLDGAAI